MRCDQPPPDALVLPVDRDGVADLDALAALLADGPPALVCLMLANNETGTIQPIAEAAALCRRHGARLHVDAVQAAGRIAVRSRRARRAQPGRFRRTSWAARRAPARCCWRPSVSTIAPLIAGGGQERGRRGGTPPLPAIAGFAAAATVAGGCQPSRAAARCGRRQRPSAEGAIVCGVGAPRLANTTCLALPGVRADAQVIALDLDGIAVSAGAACSSGKVATSHVLAAMGLGPLAGQAIRVSLPWNATGADVAAFAVAYRRMADRLRTALAPRAA